MWKEIARSLLPQAVCPLCQTALRHPPGPCPACTRELPWLGTACECCGLPLHGVSIGSRCGNCLADPPPFDRARIPFRYAPPIDHLIGTLKFRHALANAALLGTLLAQVARGGDVDLLLPLPLHPARLCERGFNQSAELCRVVARRLSLPWRHDGLHRTRASAPQHVSRRRDRLRQLRRAFVWRGTQPPSRVALIDDVVTTGATAHAAATALKQAGADWVEIWAVARTPPPE